MSKEYVTRPSLLLRVRDRDDQDSWGEFVEIYQPLILRFALSRGVNSNDAPDITQDVLRNLARAMHRFEYDPNKGTFRSWLFTVIRREIIRASKKIQRQGGHAGSDDPSDLIDQLPDEQASLDWEADYQKRLTQWAMGKIKGEFSEKSWCAFAAIAIDGDSPKDTAKRMEMTIGSLYVAKSRILKRLIEKIHSVDEEDWELDIISRNKGTGEG